MTSYKEGDLPPTFVPGFHDEEKVRKMGYKQFGNTDMVISKLSLGGAPFGGLYGTFEDVTSTVTEALKSGVNFIDTSYWYGQGRSEESLGKALADIPRSAYYIGTKVGRYELDYARMFDFRADRVVQAVEQSLQRLKLHSVDLIQVQVHDFEFSPDEGTIINETLPALDAVKRLGKTRYIGITGYPLTKIVSIIEQSQVAIDVVLTYCRGSLIDNTLQSYIPFFQERGVGLINAAPLCMGLLTLQGPNPWHPADHNIKVSCYEAAQYCKREGVNITKLAVNYSSNLNPGIHTTLVGINNIKMLNDNLEAVNESLSRRETNCMELIKDRYFSPLGDANWEDMQIRDYWRKYKEAMRTAGKPPK